MYTYTWTYIIYMFVDTQHMTTTGTDTVMSFVNIQAPCPSNAVLKVVYGTGYRDTATHIYMYACACAKVFPANESYQV